MIAETALAASAPRVRAAFERKRRALERRPAIGRGTAVTRVRLAEGLRCEVVEGDWRLTVDVGEAGGGTNAGPNPGVLGRSALGSCVAMGYAMWAAKLGVPLDEIGVEVEADYDAGPHYGVGSGTCGYSEVRCVVTLVTSASDADLQRLTQAVDAHTPYLDVFRLPVPLRHEVRRGGGGT